MLALLMAHPALGVVMSSTIMFVALSLVLCVRRVCEAVERCKGVRPAVRRRVRAERETAEVASPVSVKAAVAREDEFRAAMKDLGYSQREVDAVIPQLDLGADLPTLVRAALAKMPNKAGKVMS